ncbi:CRISPR-associated protein cas10/csm1%2C subtype III-a/mtube [Mycobacterium tuberculosis]|nr:CRISPR-associated protein cas10/csm1%2C subtype III-a/mtube [Mycobacterium tuberculosis]
MRTEAMNPQLIEAIIGCLLHDIGKPVQRAALGYPGRHSAIGRAFMKKGVVAPQPQSVAVHRRGG